MSPVLEYLPSPSQGVWHLGPIPLRAYALCILLGIVVAVLVTDRRWRARGGLRDQVADIALWCVPAGIIGGRIYHVITTPGPYFGAQGVPLHALYIWRGGLGIWGAVALGAVGAWIGCRRAGGSFSGFADALAPGLLLAQAIGRFGNWFNQELYGKPTTLPWGLKIDPEHREPGYENDATYHPTFLYEALWDAGAALLLVRLEKRFRLGHGRTFFSYVILYTLGRVWIEMLRIDPAEHILGLRLNVWTCLIVCVGGVIGFLISAARHPGVVSSVLLAPQGAPVESGAQSATRSGTADDAYGSGAGVDPVDDGDPGGRPEPAGRNSPSP